MYLGMLGFGVEAVDQFRSLNILPYLSNLYVTGDAALKDVINATQQLRHLDTLCIFRFGLVGIWIAAVNGFSFKRGRLPITVRILGLLGGALLFFTMIGNLLQSTLMMSIGAGAAVILAPIWYIWTGVKLRKESSS
jgi:hypothetical protein